VSSIAADIFEQSIGFDPGGDLEAFLREAPAKWVVYLLSDERDQPVQLLCVKNLRGSLKRRLGGEEVIGPTRRVNYREIIRRIHWRRVNSAFEADWIYYEAARRLFPETYQGMVGFRPAWFVHINPNANFPRYTKTNAIAGKSGVLVGPLEDKHAAARLVELTEDLFDLCRFYSILIQAPAAKACAYKEMGKCPAPCDGSISMEQYRQLIEWSSRAIVDPGPHIREQEHRMRQAAAELAFESAAKIKAFIEQLSQLGKARVFLITPGRIEELAGLIAEPGTTSDLPRLIFARTAEALGIVDETGAQRLGVVAHHLFLAKQSSGVFLRVENLDDKSLGRAWKELNKQKIADEADDEGLMKELQAI
jgi:excinuclease UvrABC nuclease subunit